MIRKVDRYLSGDGFTFHSEQAAREHERLVLFAKQSAPTLPLDGIAYRREFSTMWTRRTDERECACLFGRWILQNRQAVESLLANPKDTEGGG